MTFPRAVTLFGCAVGALLFGAPDASAQGLDRDPEGFLIARPEDTRPTEGGGRSVRIYEDAETGLYVTQITWPPGTGSRPHFHDQDRHIHVMKGTWWVATGEAAEVYDPVMGAWSPIPGSAARSHSGHDAGRQGYADGRCGNGLPPAVPGPGWS